MNLHRGSLPPRLPDDLLDVPEEFEPGDRSRRGLPSRLGDPDLFGDSSRLDPSRLGVAPRGLGFLVRRGISLGWSQGQSSPRGQFPVFTQVRHSPCFGFRSRSPVAALADRLLEDLMSSRFLARRFCSRCVSTIVLSLE